MEIKSFIIMKLPLKTQHLGRVRWRQTDGHIIWGGDQLPAPWDGDELLSPGTGRAGIGPEGSTPTAGSARGDAAPAATLCPRAALGRETPPGDGGPRRAAPPAHSHALSRCNAEQSAPPR